jgi:structural maintenance of chromosome 1
LRATKKEQAEASLKVKERESKVKRGEKALEDKVGPVTKEMTISVLTRQKPEIVAVDTQIAHSEKRVADMIRTVERVKKDEERQAESLASLEEGAAAITARMEEAAGKSPLLHLNPD